jgi:hypothetical protein
MDDISGMGDPPPSRIVIFLAIVPSGMGCEFQYQGFLELRNLDDEVIGT